MPFTRFVEHPKRLPYFFFWISAFHLLGHHVEEFGKVNRTTSCWLKNGWFRIKKENKERARESEREREREGERVRGKESREGREWKIDRERERERERERVSTLHFLGHHVEVFGKVSKREGKREWGGRKLAIERDIEREREREREKDRTDI